MKITNKMLSIPPHISTSWANIASIQMHNAELEIILSTGQAVFIRELPLEIIKTIFAAHADYLEKKDSSLQTSESFAKIANGPNAEADFPTRMGFNALDSFGTALQHNPAHAQAPDLPFEILQKIGSIAKIITPETEADIPKPEPHCNCMHCQIARAIQESIQGTQMEEIDDSLETETEEINEEVTDADLNFCQWEIMQTSENLFNVVNRLDTDEKYSVYLGSPVGCTCGHTGCEHILAVLKS